MIKFIVFELYKRLQKKKKKEFNRYLPLGELLIDRSKKSELLNFGDKTTIHDSSYVYGNVTIKENTWIGPFTILDGTGGLSIGSNCAISAGVQIYTHDTVKSNTSGGEKPFEYESVVIEDNCYIGPNVVIQRGVIVKKGTVIGANSFVNKSFPAGSKVAGNPAILI